MSPTPDLNAYLQVNLLGYLRLYIRSLHEDFKTWPTEDHQRTVVL